MPLICRVFTAVTLRGADDGGGASVGKQGHVTVTVGGIAVSWRPCRMSVCLNRKLRPAERKAGKGEAGSEGRMTDEDRLVASKQVPGPRAGRCFSRHISEKQR